MSEYGKLEVICGTMFSGKTEELIRRLRRANIARFKVQAFKPQIDRRYHESKISSHSGWHFDALPVLTSAEILNGLKKDTSVIGIDEAQFLDDDIISVVKRITNKGVRVILAGLDLDFRGETFGSMPELLCLAEEVSKLYAICMTCGGKACRTQRTIDGKPAHFNDPVILVGANEFYEPRCRQHHTVLDIPYKD